jgi:hypothetical protein
MTMITITIPENVLVIRIIKIYDKRYYEKLLRSYSKFCNVLFFHVFFL